MHNLNWDDFRYVLAVVEAGTVSAAAKRLGVNHATVVRRIASFEEKQSFRLFEKTPTGYRIIPEQMRVVDAMREVAAAVTATEGILAGHDAGMTGHLRITSTDTICQYIMPPVIARVAKAEPRLQIDLLSSNLTEDLSRMRADIAVRTLQQLPPELSGEVVGDLHMAIFARPDGGDRMISVSGPLAQSQVGQSILKMLDGRPPAAVADSFVVAARLAAQGLGKAVLPTYVGETDPVLIRVGSLPDLTSVPLWVACHSDMAKVPRIMNLQKLLVKELRREASRLFGEQS